MLQSRPIQEICCLTQATLFNVCLSADDLEALGLPDGERSQRGFSAAVWRRALLHRMVQQDEALARRVADRLDLAYFDTVVHVRDLDVDALRGVVDLWLERPDGRALPGLLWALCTDPRPEAHWLGARLCHETVTLACRSLVECEPALD